jgi:YgiT-type zinc finger domain-containing protein
MATEQERQKGTQEGREDLQSQAALRCKYCGCDANEDVIKAAFWTETGIIVIEDIPVRLCEGCGEQFFEEEITQGIQEVITYPPAKAKRRIRVPVYSLTQVRLTMKDRRPEVPVESQITSLESTYHQEKHAPGPIGANQDHQETFLCKYCQSQTVEDLVKSAFWVDGRLLAVENVPACVCRRCGQQFYDRGTTERIMALDKHVFASGTTRREVPVSVFSLAVQTS